MEETIWEILHLDTPTSNIDEIKKAYSEQSKKCNPEEDSEQFQKLYNAYKVAISYARRENYEEKQKKPNIDIINNEKSTEDNENDFDIIFDEELTNQDREKFKEEIKENNELINTFDDIIKNDREQFDEIQEMISDIDENITNPDELEKVVETEKFYNLMKSYDFQVNLSIYLNSRPDNGDPNYVIYIACKNFFKENPDIIPIESLKRYFEPFIRPRLNNQQTKHQKITNTFFYVIISVFILCYNMANLVIFDDSNNSDYSYKKQLITNNNEILTYEYDKEIDDIVSNDNDYRITYNIPNGYKLEDTFMNDDYSKYYENSNGMTFDVGSNPCGMDEYFESWKEFDVGKLNKIIIKDRLFYYIQFPIRIDEEIAGTNLIFWTEVSDNDVLLITTNKEVEVNSFIKIIEEVLPLNIKQKSDCP